MPPLTGQPYIVPSDLIPAIDGVGGRQRVAVVSGAAANTNIAVSGLGVNDRIQTVLEFVVSAGNFTALNDRTSVVSAISAGNFQLSVATSGSTLLVVWLDRQP